MFKEAKRLTIKKIFPFILFVFIVSSFWMFRDYKNYMEGFPIRSESDLETLADAGLLGKVIPRFETLEDEEKEKVFNKIFNDILVNEEDIAIQEADFIRENFINKKDFSDYEEIWDAYYKLAIKNGTIERVEKLRFDISYYSGFGLDEVVEKLNKVSRDHRLSFDFAGEISEKIIIAWSLASFFIVGLFYYIYRNGEAEEMPYTMPYDRKKFNLSYAKKLLVLCLSYALSSF